jgi:hypothetical protein
MAELDPDQEAALRRLRAAFGFVEIVAVVDHEGCSPASSHCHSNMCSSRLPGMHAWEAHDPTMTRPIAASLERCAELLGVDLAAIREAAAHVEPYLRVDGTRVWSLMQLERHLRPDAYGRVRGGYIARRRPRATLRP